MPNAQIRLDVPLDHDTAWLIQAQMSELEEKSNVHFLHIASADRPMPFHNLDVTISVGYRVNSTQGTRFRQWATGVLRQYLARGYAPSEQRLRESQRQLADRERLVQRQAKWPPIRSHAGS